jgi:hypothetical protein
MVEFDQALATAANHKMTDEEKEAQRRSFAYGNTNISNDAVVHAMVDKAAEQLAQQRKPGITAYYRHIDQELQKFLRLLETKGAKFTIRELTEKVEKYYDHIVRLTLPVEDQPHIHLVITSDTAVPNAIKFMVFDTRNVVGQMFRRDHIDYRVASVDIGTKSFTMQRVPDGRETIKTFHTIAKQFRQIKP